MLQRSLRYRTVRDGAVADVGRAITMASCGALAFAPIEYGLTVWSYTGTIDHKLKLAALTAGLALWMWLWLVVGLACVMVIARWLRGHFDQEAGRDLGWFVASPLAAGLRRGVPKLWATIATAGTVGLIIQRAAGWAIETHKEPELRDMLVAAIALAAFAIGIPLSRAFSTATAVAAAALEPTLGAKNPLGRWRAAGVALAGFIGAVLTAMWFVLPQSRSVMPTRLVISAIVIGLGMGMGALFHTHGRRKPRRIDALGLAAAGLVLMVMVLWQWGADLGTKYTASTASPAMDKLITLVRYSNDLDGDGYGSLLGELDCDPLDASIHPGAIDIPDDGIDQNCDGHDFSLRTPTAPAGPTLPVPAEFKKDWNVLFITVDTLRYDHTTFGGYKDGPKHRDTTPRLAQLAAKSTSFTFCNAPSAGTMASIPAIITSKYFHSGIALDENMPAGTPPKLKPENTLLSEIMKRAGYKTGVVASHEYWNNWGMDQGVDDYDNSIGHASGPHSSPADQVTDHVLAWVSRQQGHKWFMWAHYIDPHGYYEAHPDVVDYGSSQPDLYDAEIKWTDQQIGRLLDELVRLPSNDHTIIVLTSDHGDSMGEHTVPLGTHGTALYRELQHVPMIFYIPDNKPHQIGGAVSNLDIVPTIAELCGIDVRDLSFEGRSEVPAIFYGKEDHERIVFAETNAPTPQRAAISEAWKLIYYMHSALYEFYDLKADPWEHDNLAPKHPPAMAMMKAALDAWLERVVYARDPTFNQANERIADVLLKTAEAPAVATQDQTLDGDKLQIDGIGIDKGQKLAAGAKADVHVYFTVHERTPVSYKFLLAIWPIDTHTWKPTDAAPAIMFRSSMRPTADGFFASDRWRVGEHVRERFNVVIPADWHGDALAVGLVATDTAGDKATATGAAPANDPNLAILGVLPFTGSSAAPGP